MRHIFPVAFFVILAASAFSSASQGADDGSRYAAIWEKTSGPAFVARHGMTSDGYQQEFNKWTGQGYCLTLVSGYSADNQPRYAALWEKKTCPAYVARHGLTAQAYQQEFDAWTGKDYRLKLVSGYSVGGQDFYAAIWEKTPGPVFVARHRMTADGYQQEFNKWTGQGYCLTLVSGYSVGNQPRYAAIWEKKTCPAYVARHGLTAQAYQQEFDTWTGKDYRLKLVSGYRVGGQDFYAAIWEKTSGPVFVARHGMTSDGYQAEFDKLLSQGFRPTLVDGY
jgi:hypothetical protein